MICWIIGGKPHAHVPVAVKDIGSILWNKTSVADCISNGRTPTWTDLQARIQHDVHPCHKFVGNLKFTLRIWFEFRSSRSNPTHSGETLFFDAIGIKEFLQKRLDLIFHNLHGMEIHGSSASSWMISYVVSIIFVNFIHICGKWIHFDLNIFCKWVRFFQRQLDVSSLWILDGELEWKPGEFQLGHGISPCDMTTLSRYLLRIGLVVLWSINRCEVLNHENSCKDRAIEFWMDIVCDADALWLFLNSCYNWIKCS